MRKLFPLSVLLGCTLLFTACPRYETARRVSEEQLNVQRSFRTNLDEYFSHMEEFASNQVLLNKRRLRELRGDKLENLKDISDDALRAFGENPTRDEYDGNRIQLGKDIAAWNTAYDDKERELDGLTSQLHTKHTAFLSAYDEIISTQEVLNEYIKMKKYDEVVVDGLMRKLKLSQDKVNNIFREVAQVADKLSKPTAVTLAAKEGAR
ncbi:MAG TPA: hypothetical protein VKB12_09975 [Pyrinomonadaceae bacterium]|nr:hypothetical protein [Pyrinomonadaceae bacterium]